MRATVTGSSGAGKTTLGRALAARLAAPFTELDAIFHQPGWTELPEDEFRAAVADVVAGPGWVIDGNYAAVRSLVLSRADTIVWLDYSRWTVMQRVIRRSASRAITRRELWNGNREDVRRWADADHPIRWAWSQFARKRVEYEARFASPELSHLTIHRFARPRAARRWLETLASRDASVAK